MSDPPPNPTPGPSNAQTFKYATFEQVLDDLSCRFILNLPDEELRSIERVSFQVEQAHWFYEDFVRDVNPTLPSFPLRKFSAELFRSCPMLQHWSHVHDQAFDQFMAYKVRVPVCGAIMLNDKMDKCVLVKGYKSSSGWGFPKGKINQNERECDCATREVLEETGYDLSSQISEDDYFNTVVREQSITLFIVPGVPEDFPFKTRTRKEISKIEWFKLSDLPTWKRKREAPGKFYLITPFIGQLKEFISRRRKELKAQALQKGVASATTVKTKGINGVNVNVQSSVILEQRSSSDESTTPTKESSSSGNVGPTTPSPERLLFFNHENGTDKQVEPLKEMDPHLANLLNNLSVSANGQQSEQIAPTTNGIAAKTPSESGNTSFRCASPSAESISSNSIYTTPPSASTPASLAQPPPPPVSNGVITHPAKRSKHIALLDSVVEDIELSTPIDSAPLPPERHQPGNYVNRYPMTGPGRPASVAHYSYPHNALGAPPSPHPQEFAPGYHSNHQYSASSIGFPGGRGVPSPALLDSQHLSQHPMAMMNPSGIPRPLTSQSQVQMYPGSIHPHCIPPPPPRGSHHIPHPGMPPPLLPGTHQDHLLALLSPRLRTVSQPVPPASQQAPRVNPDLPHLPPGSGPLPPRESIYNSYLNGPRPPPIPPVDVPPLSLSSPLKSHDDLPNGHLRRGTGTNSQLLSILNGKPPPPKL